MKRFGLVVSLVLGLAVYFGRRSLFTWGLRLPRPRHRIQVERGLKIPMADGIHLYTDHYHPITDGKCPTILIRTPYGRNTYTGLFGWLTEFCARRFAEQGYEVLVQDTRGRFDSEGEFVPFFPEREDAQATFNWLGKQVWFDGQVGMWGSSYLGIVQWMAADHPFVKALVPGITASNLNDIIFPDGAMDISLGLRWISLLRIQQEQRRSLLQAGIFLAVERDVRTAFQHLPIIESYRALRGGPVDYYHRMMDDALHAPDFADRLHCVDHGQVKASVHLIGGWYDFFLRGLLDDFTALKAAGQMPYLTIGPWIHFSHLFLMPTMIQPGVEWFDAQLKGKHERLRAAPVRLYVMGANEWRDYPDFPPPSQPQIYYPGGENSLQAQPENAPPDHYCYDPAHPTPIVGGSQFSLGAGARNNRRLERRSDVLSFTSLCLEQPLEIIGSVSLELYIQSSSEYTDFYARLCDVDPKGRSTNICDGLLRIEPGKGETQPDGSLRITINLWATAYRFLAGHRIRLLVSSSAHPRWGRHTNTAHPLTDSIVRQAEQTIYHDLDHPSALILPTMDLL
ncbi:MAG: CocE/NonD family hydrolase [Anaerolineae bacterium]|nr:CocE/NonD family hydrolase [Anaerolineae bacterium]